MFLTGLLHSRAYKVKKKKKSTILVTSQLLVISTSILFFLNWIIVDFFL